MAQRKRPLLTTGEACQYLGISRMTLLAAEEAGLLTPARTPGGHRRYDPAELDRFLNREREEPEVPADVNPPMRSNARVALTGEATLLIREAIRRLTLLLRAESASIYLLDEQRRLHWCTSFGIPQWRVSQLAQNSPPAAVVRALLQRHRELFEASQEQFPLPTSQGHGVAVPLLAGEEVLGVLGLVSQRDRLWLPSEIQIIETAAFYIGLLIDQQQRLAELESRLKCVSRIISTSDRPQAS